MHGSFRTVPTAACRVLLLAALAAGAPAFPAPMLKNGEVLTPGKFLQSENGRFRLDLTEEGQWVVWEVLPVDAPADGSPPARGLRERSRSWLYRDALGTATLHLRSDNKLLVHDTVPWLDQPLLIWESCNVRVAPAGTGNLVLGDDGSLAILAGDRRIWEAGRDGY